MVGVLFLGVVLCLVNPVRGQRDLMILGKYQEIELGR